MKQDGKLYFDQPMKFQNLNKDFVINIQLYKRRGKEVNWERFSPLTLRKIIIMILLLFQGKEPKKIFLMKKLKELAGNTLQKTITTSSVGEKHDFECVASTRLKLENVSNRKQDKCVLKFSEVCTPLPLPFPHPTHRATGLFKNVDYYYYHYCFSLLNIP